MKSSLSVFTLLATSTVASAQTVWLQATTANEPSPRYGAAMAHDYLRDRTVLFGGAGNSQQLNDTWEWDGSAWVQRSPAITPPSGPAAMAYDRGRGRMVLVTGYGYSTQTWEYDGTVWSRVNTPTTPQGSGEDLLVYDSSTGLMRLWITGFGNGAAQTWQYNGNDWSVITAAAAPPPMRFCSMVFDPIRNRTILHGGYLQNGQTSAATWEFNGTTWLLASNQGNNPPRQEYALVFDAYRRRTVLFGGVGPFSNGGTFEYDRATWQLRTLVSPPTLRGCAIAYDTIRQEVLLFGGRDANYNTLGGTYRYRALFPATATPFGQGCAGTGVAVGFATGPYSAPYLGTTFDLRLYSLPYNQPSFVMLGTSRTASGGLPLPFSLQQLGMPGCQLLVSSDVLVSAAGAGYNASLAVPIPQQQGLIGAPLYVQAFAVDIGGNALNLINSRALDCRIGSQ